MRKLTKEGAEKGGGVEAEQGKPKEEKEQQEGEKKEEKETKN